MYTLLIVDKRRTSTSERSQHLDLDHTMRFAATYEGSESKKLVWKFRGVNNSYKASGERGLYFIYPELLRGEL